MVNGQALSGLKVLDLSRILAGPYAAQILGDLGAKVIKVEHPERGDDTRHWGPPFIGDNAAYFYTANRNKKSLGLDLKSEEGLTHLKKLLSQADVLIENFKPDTLNRLGLSDEVLKQDYPKLIHCQIQAFGEGPYKEKKGYDALIQAMGGIMSLTGPDENNPCKVGVAITDITTGLYSVIGILSALNERQSSGLGQKIEISLFDTQVSWLANSAMNFLMGQSPKPLGTAHPNIVPYQGFQTEDSPIFIAIGNDEQFKTLAQALEIKTDGYDTNKERVEKRRALVPTIQDKLSTNTREHWLKLFDKNDIPAGPINNMQELANDPQVLARELFTKMDDTSIPCLKSPLNLKRTPISTYKEPDEKPCKEYFDFTKEFL